MAGSRIRSLNCVNFGFSSISKGPSPNLTGDILNPVSPSSVVASRPQQKVTFYILRRHYLDRKERLRRKELHFHPSGMWGFVSEDRIYTFPSLRTLGSAPRLAWPLCKLYFSLQNQYFSFLPLSVLSSQALIHRMISSVNSCGQPQFPIQPPHPFPLLNMFFARNCCFHSASSWVLCVQLLSCLLDYSACGQMGL